MAGKPVPIGVDKRAPRDNGAAKEGDDLTELVSELNAQALAASLDALHAKVAELNIKVTALQAGLAGANQNIQKQSQYIGGFVQRIGGTGSTEPDPEA